MTAWAPCIQCGADGYVPRHRATWECACPKCGATLTEDASLSHAIMEYTRSYRIRGSPA